MSKTRWSNRNERKRTRVNPWAMLAEMLEADDGVVIAAQCASYGPSSGRTHDQCSQRASEPETLCIEARDAGPGKIWRPGGSITAKSFYNMEPHRAPET